MHTINDQLLLIAVLDLLKTLRIIVRQLKISIWAVIALRSFYQTISKVTLSIGGALRVHLNLTLERLRLQPSVISGLRREEVHDASTTSVAWLHYHLCRSLVRPQVEEQTVVVGRMLLHLRRGVLVGDLQVDVLDQLLVAVGGLRRLCGNTSRVGPLIFVVILLVQLIVEHIELLLQI